MDLAAIRQELFDRLDPVAAGSLAGRVYPYPPELGRVSAPAIWVEQPEAETSTIGNNTAVVTASIDVWIMADGTPAAQVATLDAATAQVWAAMTRSTSPGGPVIRPVAITRSDVETTVDGRTVRRRASVVTVEATVAAVSFCPPTPEPVEIPPALVSASS